METNVQQHLVHAFTKIADLSNRLQHVSEVVDTLIKRQFHFHTGSIEAKGGVKRFWTCCGQASNEAGCQTPTAVLGHSRQYSLQKWTCCNTPFDTKGILICCLVRVCVCVCVLCCGCVHVVCVCCVCVCCVCVVCVCCVCVRCVLCVLCVCCVGVLCGCVVCVCVCVCSLR